MGFQAQPGALAGPPSRGPDQAGAGFRPGANAGSHHDSHQFRMLSEPLVQQVSGNAESRFFQVVAVNQPPAVMPGDRTMLERIFKQSGDPQFLKSLH